MRNRELAHDYLVRVRALDLMFDAGNWTGATLESQEVVELTRRTRAANVSRCA